jgi:hypothetical protein
LENDTSPQPNQSLSNTVDAVKELLWDSIVKDSMTKIFVVLPILGWPPFALLVNFLVKTYSDYLYQALRGFLSEQMILFKNENALRQFKKSAAKLREVAEKNGVNSVEFKETRNENKKLFENFIRYDVAR